MGILAKSKVGQLSLTASAKRRALKAFGHLIGEATSDVGAEDNNRPSDNTKLGSIYARAAERRAADALREQENREAVAENAFHELSQAPTEEQNRDEIEDDWLNVFGKHAENASSEMLRDLWGKILAGEIRKPGSFSLSTLRLVSELDKQIALTFQGSVEERFSNGQFLLKPKKLQGKRLFDLIFLEEIGLVQQVAGIGGLQLSQKLSPEGKWMLAEDQLMLIGEGEAGSEFQIEVIKITRIGMEIARILPYEPLSSLRSLGTAIKEHFNSLTLNHIVERLPDGQVRYNMLEKIK